jgi:glutathione synthase/RimK-type ligase-like ATP-grasp enzyme
VTARDYVREPAPPKSSSIRVVNLCRDHSYLSLGYYCSLLAEGRGHKTIPSIDVMLDLHWKRLQRIALPEVSDLVGRTFRADPDAGLVSAHIYFRQANDPRLAEVARRIFDLFRCPSLRLTLRCRGGEWEITELAPLSIRDLDDAQKEAFREAMERYVRAAWRRQRASLPARYSIAILHDPAEALPPSNARSLEKFVKAGAQLGVEVELITRLDYGRLLEFDALFIRETTALDHHTYRFAKKAHAEDLVVIDDPNSILRCTNKIYLAELLQSNNVPTPKTLVIDRKGVDRVGPELGFPAVVKIPDGSFSRGMYRVSNGEELKAAAAKVFHESDLVIAQEYMRTDFDWRVGVLDRRPIYVCQYEMARGHWQIVKHEGEGQHIEGGSRTLAVEDAPAAVVEMALRAASLIGDGLYGVDLKETPRGIFVVEVNDNPSIDAGVEDLVLKDDLYRLILEYFVERLDRRSQPQPPRPARGANGRGSKAAK